MHAGMQAEALTVQFCRINPVPNNSPGIGSGWASSWPVSTGENRYLVFVYMLLLLLFLLLLLLFMLRVRHAVLAHAETMHGQHTA
jgi:hypothetical protein